MQTNRHQSLRYVAKVGILAAMATVLMFLEFPLPFLAPGFYKLDFSEVPVLIGSFALGPLSGVLIELLKNLLKFLITGSSTAGVGELSNFLTGCVFILPAALFYRVKKTRRGALLGLLLGGALFVAVGAVANYFVLIPLYSHLYGLPLDVIVGMGNAIHPAITDLRMLVLLAVVPFNLVKAVLDAVITFFLYKRVSFLLHT